MRRSPQGTRCGAQRSTYRGASPRGAETSPAPNPNTLADTAAARAALEKSLALRPLSEPSGRAASLELLALALLRAGLIVEAEGRLAEAEKLRREVNSEGVDAALTQRLRGYVRSAQGRFGDARQELSVAHEVLVGALGRKHPETLRAARALGEAELELGQTEVALARLSEVVEFASPLRVDPLLSVQAKLALARARRATGANQEADRTVREVRADVARGVSLPPSLLAAIKTWPRMRPVTVVFP